MAVSSSTTNSFKVVGVPQCVAAFDQYSTDAESKRIIGFKAEDAQGSVYRYAHFGAAVTPGLVVSQDISESSVVDTDNIVVAPASAQTTTDGTVGSRFVEITLASVAANDYAGGKLVITGGTGVGYTYNIIGNTATGDPASGNFRVELDHPLVAALSSDSDITIAGPVYGNLEAATSTDFEVAGVSLGTHAAGEYGWIQTKGVVGALVDVQVTAGEAVIVGSVAGSVTSNGTATNDNILGYALATGDDAGYSSIKINVE